MSFSEFGESLSLPKKKKKKSQLYFSEKIMKDKDQGLTVTGNEKIFEFINFTNVDNIIPIFH